MGKLDTTDLRVGPAFLTHLQAIVSAPYLKVDDQSRMVYGADALKRGRHPDAVVLPANTWEVAAIVRLCA